MPAIVPVTHRGPLEPMSRRPRSSLHKGDFARTLRKDAGRTLIATDTNTAPGVPAGYHSVNPWVISRDTARLIDFAKDAFGARELARVEGDDGSIGHAEMRIGDSVVLMFDKRPDWPDTPAFLRLYVEDGDFVFQQALKAGAEPVTDMTDLYFGDRVGRVRDPLGNIWWIQQHVEDLTLDEIGRRATQPEAIEAMRYVQNASFFPTG